MCVLRAGNATQNVTMTSTLEHKESTDGLNKMKSSPPSNRSTKSETKSRLATARTDQQHFEHDCTRCDFVWHYSDMDWFVCKDHNGNNVRDVVVARFGNNPNDFHAANHTSERPPFGWNMPIGKATYMKWLELRITQDYFKCPYCDGSGEAYDPSTGEGPTCPLCKGQGYS